MAGDMLQELTLLSAYSCILQLYCAAERRNAVLPLELEKQFNDFYRAAYADGELDSKTKVLIGLAVAMTQGCAP